MSNSAKQVIRTSCRNIRETLSPTFQQQASAVICEKITHIEQYDNAKHIAFYYPCQGEIDLNELWRTSILQEKKCYFPVMNALKELSFLPTTALTRFIVNKHGIPEPDTDITEAIPLNNLDIIFMPLVAFDRHGTRIGMGGGYYDKTLANTAHPLLIGVAYEFQQVTLLTPDNWDIPLSAVITEKSVYWCS